MKKLRWAMEGEAFWEQDMSTPVTLDGVAKPVQGDTIPLGIGRGVRLSRHGQVDFFQRFMAMPFVPSFSQHHKGFSIQRLLSLPFPFSQRWFPAVLGQLNVQEVLKCFRNNRSCSSSKPLSSWLQTLRTTLSDKSLYALNFCSELLLSPDDVLLLSFEAYGDHKLPRTKALLQHKFPHHNLTVEASHPGLFVDHHGCYWDVPFTLDVDLASVSSHSGASYHFCLHHSTGSPAQLEGQPTSGVPPALLPGLCAKCAVSFKKTIDVWRSDAPKLKMVQPYDIFLSNPHISASGIIGAVVTASVGHNSIRVQGQNESRSWNWKGLSFRTQGVNSAVLTDLLASVSLSAQYGNFQKPLLDLTRFCAQLDFPCGSKFVSGASRVAYDLYNGQVPRTDAVESVCPNATISFQQQIAGPFSLRIESGVRIDLKRREWWLKMNNAVFAIEYALQVLGSAKAVAWYAPKQRELMMELRFFET